MKHFLIGLLFCFGFLLFAGVTQTQAQTQTTPTFVPTYQLFYPDIGKPAISIGNIQNRFAESFAIANYSFDKQVQRGFAIDIAKLREISRIAVFQTNEALFYRYRYVPECNVQYISKGYGRYFYYNHLYIQPPKW